MMVLIATLVLGSGSAWAEWLPAAEIQPRVDHHIREVGVLIEHFETFVAGECPRFSTTADWETYAESEIDRMLLLAAHAEQAWVEAKRTGDDDVRRAAKAPRRRLDEAPRILNKLSACAEGNGVTLAPGSVYRRLERDLPRRQSEISLPR
ncbi:MAG TPA: hypothetical protein VK548_03865 [Candidatus Acidoferrum sp.]|nr:hypothetical protein [Candidatus Acidoferrum sp.]